jgi:hypothetical protein
MCSFVTIVSVAPRNVTDDFTVADETMFGYGGFGGGYGGFGGFGGFGYDDDMGSLREGFARKSAAASRREGAARDAFTTAVLEVEIPPKAKWVHTCPRCNMRCPRRVWVPWLPSRLTFGSVGSRAGALRAVLCCQVLVIIDRVLAHYILLLACSGDIPPRHSVWCPRRIRVP